MKNLFFTHLKPQNYYNKLFSIFLIISLILTFSINNFSFNIVYFDEFLLKFIIIFFLLISISILVEYFEKTDYIGPIEIYDIQFFFNNFLDDLKTSKNINTFNYKSYFNKYDHKSRKKLKDLLKKKNKKFYLSSIHKKGSIYHVKFIDEITLFRFFFIRFFAGSGVHEIHIKKEKNDFRIIFIN